LATVQGPSSTANPQLPSGSQTPDRQTTASFDEVHGPSLFRNPHSLSVVSQTALVQTKAPAAAVHVPSSVGFVWGGESVGIIVPFASVGTHIFAVSLHQSPVGQTESTEHPTVVLTWGPMRGVSPVP
jgi:hypothetical protein